MVQVGGWPVVGLQARLPNSMAGGLTVAGWVVELWAVAEGAA